MKQEIWKDIIEYEGAYQVSTMGRIKSMRRKVIGNRGCWRQMEEKILAQNYIGEYKRIGLSKNKIKNTFLVHRLVTEAFIPNPENKPEVNHLNSKKDDNRLVNLEWSTHSENMLHGFKHGNRSTTGEKNPSARLTEKDVMNILKNKNMSTRNLADKYSITPESIRNIIRNKSWTHIDRVNH